MLGAIRANEFGARSEDYEPPAAEGRDRRRFRQTKAWLGDELEEKPAEARVKRWTNARSWRSCSSAATT